VRWRQQTEKETAMFTYHFAPCSVSEEEAMAATSNFTLFDQAPVPVAELPRALSGVARDLEREFGATLSRERIEQVVAGEAFDLRMAPITRWLPLLIYRRSCERLRLAVAAEARAIATAPALADADETRPSTEVAERAWPSARKLARRIQPAA
jgi:hypothetical protein